MTKKDHLDRTANESRDLVGLPHSHLTLMVEILAQDKATNQDTDQILPLVPPQSDHQKD